MCTCIQHPAQDRILIITDENHLLEVTEYLSTLVSRRDIKSLGLVLGLSPTRLEGFEQSSDNLLDSVILAWLRGEGEVGRQLQPPTWDSLVTALLHQRLSQTGIADAIIRAKNIQRRT